MCGNTKSAAIYPWSVHMRELSVDNEHDCVAGSVLANSILLEQKQKRIVKLEGECGSLNAGVSTIATELTAVETTTNDLRAEIVRNLRDRF